MTPEEFDPNLKVINSNDLLDTKISEYEAVRAKKKAEEAKAQAMAEYEAKIEAGEIEEGDVPEFQESFGPSEEDIEACNVQIDEMLAQANEQAEAIIAQANEQAQSILDEASISAESMKKQAIEEGKKQGYDLGVAMGQADMDAKTAELDEVDKQRQLEYLNKVEEIEKELIDVVCDVVGKVFMTQFSDKKDIIIHLCDNAIANIDSSKEFQIKVNEKTHDFLQTNKSQIEGKLGSDVQLDIVLDPLLDDDQCIIETDGGVFECSLGVQLENLLKDIKSLCV